LERRRGFRDGDRPQMKVAHVSVLLMHAGGYRSLGEDYYHHSDSPGGKKVIITPTTKTTPLLFCGCTGRPEKHVYTLLAYK